MGEVSEEKQHVANLISENNRLQEQVGFVTKFLSVFTLSVSMQFVFCSCFVWLLFKFQCFFANFLRSIPSHFIFCLNGTVLCTFVFQILLFSGNRTFLQTIHIISLLIFANSYVH